VKFPRPTHPYIRLVEGWLYLAVILDCFSRRVVGWSLSRNIDADLVCAALEMALSRRCPQSDLVHHSDRGVQYASQALRDQLKRAGVTMSMSRKGDPWDNAMMESFFGTLKTEWIATGYATEEEARMEVFKYIEMFYNPTRRHSALGYLSPIEYERRHEAGQLPMN
jgi:putative transposase